jgi:cytochrome c-type biogenesis protein CcmH
MSASRLRRSARGVSSGVAGLGLALLLLLLGPLARAIDNDVAFADALRQGRYEHLTSELRCLVCQNQTVADSNADLAADLRRQVREMIAAGQTDDAIKTYMTERYGDFVLYDPPWTARTYLLWSAPVLLVLIALLSVARVIRRRSRMPWSEDGEATP